MQGGAAGEDLGLGDDDGVGTLGCWGEKGRSHSWMRDQARSLTALWMGIMEGMVRARWVSADWEEVVVVVVVLVDAGVRRVDGLCLRRTAVKNCCSEG